MPQYVRAAPTARRGQAIGIAASGLMAVQGLGILLGGVVATRANPALAVGPAGALGTVLGAVTTLRRQRLLDHTPAGVPVDPVSTIV